MGPYANFFQQNPHGDHNLIGGGRFLSGCFGFSSFGIFLKLTEARARPEDRDTAAARDPFHAEHSNEKCFDPDPTFIPPVFLFSGLKEKPGSQSSSTYSCTEINESLSATRINDLAPGIG